MLGGHGAGENENAAADHRSKADGSQRSAVQYAVQLGPGFDLASDRSHRFAGCQLFQHGMLPLGNWSKSLTAARAAASHCLIMAAMTPQTPENSAGPDWTTPRPIDATYW